MKEVLIRSTYDNTLQPSLMYSVDNNRPRPLLVGLHSWSCDRTNQIENLLPITKRNEWHLVLPEFRGPNLKTNSNARYACGSIAAKQDILDAVDYMKKNYLVDSDNILLIGGSGGGHMALLAAGYAPKLWKAVCSYCPLTDVKRWYEELYKVYIETGGSESYVKGIEACCGGAPNDNNIQEYLYRSPISYINEIAQANIKIFHGRFDMSISYFHSMDLYCELSRKFPQARVFLDIFDGPHEMYPEVAEKWFLHQMKVNDYDTRVMISK